MHAPTSHPAVKLGAWLKTSRQQKGIVKRLFAGLINLTPSQYSELEAGVVRWLGSSQRQAIATALDLAAAELKQFQTMVDSAMAAPRLLFGNVFSREELEPIRYRHNDRLQQPSEMEKEMILNGVFAEIA
ncbi:MAG: hypothetical protein P4L99_29275 [Chthoniobacter sp.]|nr:hypothetical protein [Chthoniobacter sp.]